MKIRKIELLAPARDLECGIAAVDYGADAVYMGAARFGARKAAGNSIEDIARMVNYARPYHVKVYATLNTLIYEDELRESEALARELIDAGVDALIIQDTAFLGMDIPPVRIHASTQMHNTDAENIRFLELCGFSRVVLERGLTLEQITAIRENTNMELECFVHGAICVGHSGRCYMSRSMGPRSGNRGDCSQPCRLSYDLENSAGETIVKGKHLLSVKDLDLSGELGALLDAGVDSFKIEGRLKDASYVKNITLHYRNLLDAEISRRPDTVRASSGRTDTLFIPDPEKTFSRGRSTWMFNGASKGVATFDSPKSTGAYVGCVLSVGRGYFEIDSPGILGTGDGITFSSHGIIRGTNINGVEGSRVFPNTQEGIYEGTEIYRNHDHTFYTTLKNSAARRDISAKATVTFMRDSVLLTVIDSDRYRGSAIFNGTGEPAKDQRKMLETLNKQILKTGDTVFSIREVSVRKESDREVPFLPVSVINRLRREALEDLVQARVDSMKQKDIPDRSKEIPRFPEMGGGGYLNITNSLAENFYRSHGVDDPQQGHDLSEDLPGIAVMTTPYCLRRELNACLRENSIPENMIGQLFLRRGSLRYSLEFDCVNCLMRVYKVR